MAKAKKQTEIQSTTKAHFEAVKDFYKKKAKDVHLPRKIRKEIAKVKTLANKEESVSRVSKGKDE